MLFDLRSPRRRRFIKVIYSGLAILLGGGLVLFGIGSDATGGLSEVFGGGNSGGGSIQDTVQDDIDAAEEILATNPRNQDALIELVTLYSQAGRSQLATDEQTGRAVLTTDASESFNRAADAWDSYLKTKPKNPDTGAAIQMSQAFFTLAENAQTLAEARLQLASAAEAQQVLAGADPSAEAFSSLAFYAYLAGDFDQGDTAAARAAALSEPADRKQLTAQLEAAEKQGRQIAKRAKQEAKAGAGPGATGGNPLEGIGGIGGAGGLASP